MKLKELRKEKGITQKELSQAIGYAQSTISDWEKGNIEPTASAIIKICDYFDISADYLLGRKEY